MANHYGKTVHSLYCPSAGLIVLSRIDYGSLLLFGSTLYELDRVQRLQNRAARLVCSTPLRGHITPSGNFTGYRSENGFILNLLFLFTNAWTKLLLDIFPLYCHIRTLLHVFFRPHLTSLTWMFPVQTKFWVKKAFSVAGPMIWNDLPPVIRESVSLSLFRKVLKTRLYPC